jgi:RNA polymerase sigma-70 factor (ECF subfamily)
MEDFQSILAQYQDKVYRFALGMLGDPAQAEDAAQETFVKIWRGLPKFRGESSISTWIFSIARNTCLNALKSRRKMVSIDELVEKPRLEREPMDIEGLLEELPEHYREVMLLFYVHDKSYEEVARTLDIPMGTVKTYLHRARKQLIAGIAQSKMEKEQR